MNRVGIKWTVYIQRLKDGEDLKASVAPPYPGVPPPPPEVLPFKGVIHVWAALHLKHASIRNFFSTPAATM